MKKAENESEVADNQDYRKPVPKTNYKLKHPGESTHGVDSIVENRFMRPGKPQIAKIASNLGGK